MQMPFGDGGAVNADFKVAGQARHFEHLGSVGTGGHHGAAQSCLLDGAEVAHRAIEYLDAVGLDALEQKLILAVAEAADGPGIRRIAGRALGQGDTARPQEVPHTVPAWLAVHVLVIVVMNIERAVHAAFGLSPPPQEIIEHVPPGRSVDRSSLCQDAVKVEKARLNAVWEAKHPTFIPRFGTGSGVQASHGAACADARLATSSRWRGAVPDR